jgi:hypothetical protein
MLHLLKHTALRLWATLCMGVPAGLAMLTALNEPPGTAWPLALMGAILAGVFLLVGWGANRIGRRAVARRLSDSAVLERAGHIGAAEAALRQAVALYDSFVMSPLARRQMADRLLDRLARFHLARPDRRAEGLGSVRAYLARHPQDRSMAEAWMRWIEEPGRARAADEDLVDRVAAARADDLDLQRLLGRHCLASGRTDFQALTIYRRVIEGDRQAAPEWIRRLAGLFLREGRADDWALQIYLDAWDGGKDRADLQRGLAACLNHLVENDDNRGGLARARDCLAGCDAVDLEILGEGFKGPRPPQRRALRPAAAGQPVRRALTALRRSGRDLMAAVGHAGRSRAVRRGLVWAAATTSAAGLALLLVNTLGHLMVRESPPAATPPPPQPRAAIVLHPYTIQVAAYLRQAHAQRLVEQLQRQKIDARWNEARGKDRIWYQVRVSHFADKESALAYGQDLKRQGLIEDFYVANHEGP